MAKPFNHDQHAVNKFTRHFATKPAHKWAGNYILNETRTLQQLIHAILITHF